MNTYGPIPESVVAVSPRAVAALFHAAQLQRRSRVGRFRLRELSRAMGYGPRSYSAVYPFVLQLVWAGLVEAVRGPRRVRFYRVRPGLRFTRE